MIEEHALRLDTPLVVAGVSMGPAQGPGRRAGRLCRTRASEHGTRISCSPGRMSPRSPTTPRAPRCSREVEAVWHTLPRAVRRRVHLALLPMDDADENAAIVNALQRRADVVVQKSLAEGFGLTVAEAMWKGRPVVASRVGGIQDQIEDGETGLARRADTTSPPSGSASARCWPTRMRPSGWARRLRCVCATTSSGRAISASTSICSSACSPSADDTERRPRSALRSESYATAVGGARTTHALARVRSQDEQAAGRRHGARRARGNGAGAAAEWSRRGNRPGSSDRPPVRRRCRRAGAIAVAIVRQGMRVIVRAPGGRGAPLNGVAPARERDRAARRGDGPGRSYRR